MPSSIWYIASLAAQIARFIGPTWGPHGSCRPHVGPMLAQWTLLSVWTPFANDAMETSILFVWGPWYMRNEERKWPQCCRQHVQMHFIECKLLNLIWISVLAVPNDATDNKSYLFLGISWRQFRETRYVKACFMRTVTCQIRWCYFHQIKLPYDNTGNVLQRDQNKHSLSLYFKASHVATASLGYIV